MELTGCISRPVPKGHRPPASDRRVLVAAVAHSSSPPVDTPCSPSRPPDSSTAGARNRCARAPDEPVRTRRPAHTQRSPQRYTVRKGDTLSQIALDRPATPTDTRGSSSLATSTSGGRRLTNPDLIDIGWTSFAAKSKTDRRNHGEAPERSSSSANGTTGRRSSDRHHDRATKSSIFPGADDQRHRPPRQPLHRRQPTRRLPERRSRRPTRTSRQTTSSPAGYSPASPGQAASSPDRCGWHSDDAAPCRATIAGTGS